MQEATTRTLGPSPACCQDVLSRLSQRLARVLEEVDRYHHHHQQQEQQQRRGEEGNATALGNGSAVLSRPPLQVRHRVDALRASLRERKTLNESVDAVNTLMEQLATESLIDLRSTSETCVRRAADAGDSCNRDVANDVCTHNSHRNSSDASIADEGGAQQQELTARRLVWLRQQSHRHRDEFRELRQRASRAYETLRPLIDGTADVCAGVFSACADDSSDPSELHALCRSNGVRARRLQERLARVLDTYRRVVARSNLEMCRLDLEVQALEQQSLQPEDMLLQR
ncbi:putative actin-like protein [Trypanosoma grayi]|uniref:putative actin-like protein n=1 Tax=Trypanosoma grayi TaxID=71804 RepID=UPI0004F40F59|nr:putative actin-like protein [Trypanosoma grayi]KEG09671.1 putative actin-like protein [Trypanosoma grayi]